MTKKSQGKVHSKMQGVGMQNVKYKSVRYVMKSLKRNKQTIYYALYSSETPILDENGFDTGEVDMGYSKPIELRICVSPNKGDTESTAFGTSLDYDRTMITSESLGIDEQTILWVDIMPILDATGATITKHDYTVKKVAKSINSSQYAIKKVKVS